MEAPLIGIAKALVRHLEEAGVEVTPDLDMAVEACRNSLKKGSRDFMDLAEKTFTNRISPKRKARSVFKKFREDVKVWVAELVLTEREL